MKKQKGITLIALIVTIIIMLILSGVAISQITGENGLFTRAKQAKLETKRSQVIEFLRLKLIEVQGTEETLTENEILEKTKQNIINDKQELEKIVKKLEEVGEIKTEEDGEKVNSYFYVTADKDVYKVELAGVSFKGEAGKFTPTIKIISLTSESNSITIEVKTERKGNGKIEYYIKEEGEEKYQLKETQSEERYVYNGLKQGKKYNIKVVVIAENKQKAEVEGEKTTGEVINLKEGDIKFEYIVEGKEIEATKWSNKDVTVKAIPNIDIGNYKLQTSTDGENFEEKDNQTFNANGTMYAILTDGTNYGGSATCTVSNIDKTEPSSASISLSKTTTYINTEITAIVTHSDNQSGVKIASCKWVYNTTSTGIGTSASSYPNTFSSNGQNITLKATSAGTYYLHILTTDNAGNTKETISKAVTVSLVTATGSTSDTITNKKIDMTWTELVSAADIIAKTSSINKNTTSVTVYGKKLTVGDYTTVKYNEINKKVRIIGFNHDTLATPTDGKTKAGITFEFVTTLTDAYMNNNSTNSGGWGVSYMKTNYMPSYLSKIESTVKNAIKPVRKTYNLGNQTTSTSTSTDNLWLLAFTEIYGNGIATPSFPRGYCSANEGPQYKYYNLSINEYTASYAILRKEANYSNTSNNNPVYKTWWLRSPYYNDSNSFCTIHNGGYCDRFTCGTTYAVAPGFCI